MRRSLVLIGALTLASVAGAGTAMGDPVAGPIAKNLPPRVALISPTDGFIGVSGCPITFSASAVDGDNEIMRGPDDIPIFAPDGIDRVEFYVNDRLLATDNIAPYEITVDRGPFIPQSSGKNTAFARAYDTDKPQLNADSEIVSFLLVDPPPGLPDEPFCP
ncbi:hypothetical protein GCM10009555_057620 [Acrocarpospora macrocephala]|uniref:Uncharacterized protein n=1 Tax=Acrocarpospora macrocephala TaxID=150177 RepID=A0A5M3WNL8_9ACTN|nr:Ig-like domain-containing protein [Acrocarpospora macrocephala]GES08353.1 hypothetical protein Amac_019490 [Acrocarpospora macrocephala]